MASFIAAIHSTIRSHVCSFLSCKRFEFILPECLLSAVNAAASAVLFGKKPDKNNRMLQIKVIIAAIFHQTDNGIGGIGQGHLYRT